MNPAEHGRNTARAIFTRALHRTTVAAAFARDVRCEGHTLQVCDLHYDLSRYSEVCVVAAGKAAASMFDAIDRLLPEWVPARSVVSAPVAPHRLRAGTRFFAGGHPEPNAASLEAGAAALRLLQSSAKDALILFLISGGASAMLELPLRADVSLADMVSLHRVLVGSGATIAEVNCVRKHLSAVKGGRLALCAGQRDKLTLLVSDVPAGSEDALGSGPSLPDSSTVADCLDVLTRYDLRERLPASLRRCLSPGLEETPKPHHQALRHAEARVLLDNSAVLAQAAHVAADLGYGVEVDCGCDDWAYDAAARYLLSRLDRLQAGGRKVCLLSGGEVTVKLPPTTGIGGRNSQFCLACAQQGIPHGVTVLSAGTDGVDGNSDAAGAVADWTTRTRGERFGMQIDRSLRGFDAASFFTALGDAVLTGPTGNNLRDLRILLWDPAAR